MQIFKLADRSYGIVQYKQKNLIVDTSADKVVNADKGQDYIAYKKLNAVANKVVGTNTRQNIATKSLILIKNKIARRKKLTSCIGVE